MLLDVRKTRVNEYKLNMRYSIHVLKVLHMLHFSLRIIVQYCEPIYEHI